MKSHDTVEDAAFAMLQLWELKDNILAAHEISVRVIEETTGESSNMLRSTAMLRMTTSWIVITLWKIHELWQRYAYLSSDITKRIMGKLDKQILDRNIKRVRNTIAAHLLEEKTKKPVSPSLVFAELMSTWKQDPEGFFVWLVGRGPEAFSVCGCLQGFFDELQVNHPGALQEMMLAEQQKMTGYPSHLPKFLDKNGNLVK